MNKTMNMSGLLARLREMAAHLEGDARTKCLDLCALVQHQIKTSGDLEVHVVMEGYNVQIVRLCADARPAPKASPVDEQAAKKMADDVLARLMEKR